MEIVEDTLDTELEEFLARPLFCHLGTTSAEGPRVSPLWFLWEDGAIWIIATLSNKTFPDRIKEDPRTAVSIVDFDSETGRVEHVGLRGHATVEPFEEIEVSVFSLNISDMMNQSGMSNFRI